MESFVIGLLQAPYGLKGELRVKSYSGETEHFLSLAGKSVSLIHSRANLGPGQPSRQGQKREIETVRLVFPHLLIKFKGIETPETARSLTGYEISVDRTQAAPLGKQEYYIGDLVGCTLEFQGKVVGTVESVWDSGASSMLEVRKVPDPEAETEASEETVLEGNSDAMVAKGAEKKKSAEKKKDEMAQIPFGAPYVGRVDMDRRSIELLVEWILS